MNLKYFWYYFMFTFWDLLSYSAHWSLIIEALSFISVFYSNVVKCVNLTLSYSVLYVVM